MKLKNLEKATTLAEQIGRGDGIVSHIKTLGTPYKLDRFGTFVKNLDKKHKHDVYVCIEKIVNELKEEVEKL